MLEKHQPLLATQNSNKRPLRPASAFNHNFLRNHFTITTWLAMGGFLQLALFLLPIKKYYAATPVVVYLAWEIADHMLMMFGLKKDPYSSRALQTKFTAIFPNDDGTFTRAGGEGNKVSVFFLGFRSNHILGALAPGAKEVAKFAQGMARDLEENAAETGLLGSSLYFNAGASTTGSEIITVYYFKAMADVQRYAESELHRTAWDWYNRHVKQYPHMGIMHEIYEAPAGKWENIYKNWEPSLFAATSHRVIDQEGNEKWVSPLVDATRGKMSTTHGRIRG